MISLPYGGAALGTVTAESATRRRETCLLRQPLGALMAYCLYRRAARCQQQLVGVLVLVSVGVSQKNGARGRGAESIACGHPHGLLAARRRGEAVSAFAAAAAEPEAHWRSKRVDDFFSNYACHPCALRVESWCMIE